METRQSARKRKTAEEETATRRKTRNDVEVEIIEVVERKKDSAATVFSSLLRYYPSSFSKSSSSTNDDTSSSSSSEASFSSSPATSSQHVLLNPLILDTLFSYCNLEDLKVVRQVCKLWKTNARPFIQKKASCSRTKWFNKNECKRGMTNFTKVMKTAEYLPVTKFYFKIADESVLAAVWQFCRKFGYCIKSACFSCVWMKEPSELIDLIRDISKNLPILEELNVRTVHKKNALKPFPCLFDGPEFPKILTIKVLILSWKWGGSCFNNRIILDILKACPNITVFKMPDMEYHQAKIIDALVGLESNMKRNLTELLLVDGDIRKEKQAVTLNHLIDANLRLKKFTLSGMSLSNSAVVRSTFLRFIETQRKTLTKLEFPDFCTHEDIIQVLIMPDMEALEELNLGEYAVPVFQNPAKTFPVLKSLDMKKLRFYRYKLEPAANLLAADFFQSPCPTVTTLSLPDNLSPSRFADLLGTIFPNVTNLTLNCPNWKVLELIWSSWPNLRILNIKEIAYSEGAVNGAIIGATESEYSRLKRSKKAFRTFDVKKLTRPSIRDLTNLQTLSIDFEWLREESGYMGIMHLKQLKELCLNWDGSRYASLDLIKGLPSLHTWKINFLDSMNRCDHTKPLHRPTVFGGLPYLHHLVRLRCQCKRKTLSSHEPNRIVDYHYHYEFSRANFSSYSDSSSALDSDSS